MGAMAIDNGFCSMNNKTGWSTAGRRDRYMPRIYDDKILSSPGWVVLMKWAATSYWLVPLTNCTAWWRQWWTLLMAFWTLRGDSGLVKCRWCCSPHPEALTLALWVFCNLNSLFDLLVYLDQSEISPRILESVFQLYLCPSTLPSQTPQCCILCCVSTV